MHPRCPMRRRVHATPPPPLPPSLSELSIAGVVAKLRGLSALAWQQCESSGLSPSTLGTICTLLCVAIALCAHRWQLRREVHRLQGKLRAAEPARATREDAPPAPPVERARPTKKAASTLDAPAARRRQSVEQFSTKRREAWHKEQEQRAAANRWSNPRGGPASSVPSSGVIRASGTSATPSRWALARGAVLVAGIRTRQISQRMDDDSRSASERLRRSWQRVRRLISVASAPISPARAHHHACVDSQELELRAERDAKLRQLGGSSSAPSCFSTASSSKSSRTQSRTPSMPSSPSMFSTPSATPRSSRHAPAPASSCRNGTPKSTVRACCTPPAAAKRHPATQGPPASREGPGSTRGLRRWLSFGSCG